MKRFKVPKGLQAAGKKFYKKVLSEYELSEAHDMARLMMAAKCLDDLSEAENRVKDDGMFTRNRYGATVEHPGLKVVRDTRLLFVKIIRELGLDITTPGDSRPPRQY